MTDNQLAEYYAKLLILQYKGKPKAYETIKALVAPIIMNQIPIAVQDGFSIDTAIGVQLDVIGVYAGVTRNGFGTNGPITLGDEDFRVLIRMAIIRNNSGSSLYEIVNLLNTYFGSQVLVYDLANMNMNYVISSSVGSSDLIQMIISQELLPKPMGVQLAAIVYIPDVNSLFGMRSYELPATSQPLNSYEDYQTTRPFLDYDMAINI